MVGGRAVQWLAGLQRQRLPWRKEEEGWLAGPDGQKRPAGRKPAAEKKRKIGWVAWWAGPNTEKEMEICF
jgi:hypothetical protein